MTPYPAVLLGVPLGAEGVERLAPLGAVGELEEAGEYTPVLGCVGEDGVLEVDAVGEDVVVLIHPAGDMNRRSSEEAFNGSCLMNLCCLAAKIFLCKITSNYSCQMCSVSV